MFYPAQAEGLRALIESARGRARADGNVAPKLVIAPHAGLVYSGSVAATAFGPWARRADPPRRVVIVGPAHRFAFRGLALHPAAAWRTPLGETKVARELHALLAEARIAAVDPRPFAGEHSLEMHLVVLQAMLPVPFEILPILVGDADPRRVAEALRLVWGGPETVIAVSSDLSHFLDRRSAEDDRFRHRAAHRDSRRQIAREQARLRLPADHGGAGDRRRARLEGERPASGDLGRRWRGRFARRRLRRLRVRIRRLRAALRRRPRLLAVRLHGRARRRRQGAAARRRRFDFEDSPPALSPWRATFRHPD